MIIQLSTLYCSLKVWFTLTSFGGSSAGFFGPSTSYVPVSSISPWVDWGSCVYGRGELMDVETFSPCTRLGKLYWYVHHSYCGKPERAGTKLRRCVCIRPCLQPYSINFKYAFNYFPKIECPRALAQCSVGNRSGDSSSLRMHGTLLLVVTAATDSPSTAGCSPTVQNYTRRVEIASGKGSA